MGYAPGLVWVKYNQKLVFAFLDHPHHLNREPIVSSPREDTITPSSNFQSSFNSSVDPSSYLYDMQCDAVQGHN